MSYDVEEYVSHFQTWVFPHGGRRSGEAITRLRVEPSGQVFHARGFLFFCLEALLGDALILRKVVVVVVDLRYVRQYRLDIP